MRHVLWGLPDFVGMTLVAASKPGFIVDQFDQAEIKENGVSWNRPTVYDGGNFGFYQKLGLQHAR